MGEFSKLIRIEEIPIGTMETLEVLLGVQYLDGVEITLGNVVFEVFSDVQMDPSE